MVVKGRVVVLVGVFLGGNDVAEQVDTEGWGGGGGGEEGEEGNDIHSRFRAPGVPGEWISLRAE